MRQGWARHLVCSRTGVEATIDEPATLSPASAPWLVEYDLTAGRKLGQVLLRRLVHRDWSMWRYLELLPIADPGGLRSVGEGGTPLVPFPAPERLPEARVWFKDESGNPGGSFKARGMALAVARARELGAGGIELASAGNAAIALSLYGAVYGIRTRVAVPIDTPATVVESCRRFGAEVIEAGSDLVESGLELLARSAGYWNLSTLREPYRLEGKKTLGYELAEQFGWSLPDWIIYPTGGGTGLIGMHKAFAELRALGLAPQRTPRFVAVQMEGCAPIVRAFEEGEERAMPWEDPTTEVWGLRVPRAIGDFLILRALRESDGLAIAVAEESVREQQLLLARELGLDWGPEGVACAVALRELATRGVFGRQDRIVLFQTGHPGNYR